MSGWIQAAMQQNTITYGLFPYLQSLQRTNHIVMTWNYMNNHGNFAAKRPLKGPWFESGFGLVPHQYCLAIDQTFPCKT